MRHRPKTPGTTSVVEGLSKAYVRRLMKGIFMKSIQTNLKVDKI